MRTVLLICGIIIRDALTSEKPSDQVITFLVIIFIMVIIMDITDFLRRR